MNDLVSVIVPVYNVEQYLSQCVDSIRNQTYENIEILLIDDGSPDNCPKICDGYAAIDGRIKVIHKKNGGLSDARNVGIDHSTGKWLMFIDSDDFIEPTMVEVMLTAAVNRQAQMAVCNVLLYYDSNGDQPAYDVPEQWSDFHLSDTLNSGMDILKCVKEYIKIPCIYVIAWNKLYSREIFESIRYPVGQIHEDEAIAHRVLACSEKIATVSAYLYHYRQRPGSIMSSEYTLKRMDIYLAYSDRIRFYAANGLTDYISALHDQAFWGYISRYYRFDSDPANAKELRKYRHAMLKTIPVYFKRKDIGIKMKISRLILFTVPSIFKKKWYQPPKEENWK